MKDIDTPIYLEIFFEDLEDVKNDLIEIFDTPDFKEKLKSELLERLSAAILQNRKELAIFRLVYYGVDLKVKKNQYEKLLNKVLELYQEEEDYLKCVEIKNLLDKL